MRQQINLYQPIFRKEEKVFSAKTLLIAFVAAIVVFSSVFFFARWNVYALEKESERLKVTYANELVRLEDLAKRYPVKKKSRIVEDEVTRLQQEQIAKQFLIKTLSGRSIGNSNGFSSYFVGMARQQVQGLWIRQFELQQGGDVIGIHGSTLEPEYVPKFLLNLSSEDSFNGSSFRIFKMQRDEKQDQTINFSLRTLSTEQP